MQHHDNPRYHRWLKNVDIMQYFDRGNVFSGWPFPLCSMLGGYDNQARWEWPTTENIEWVSIYHYINGSKQPWDSQDFNGAAWVIQDYNEMLKVSMSLRFSFLYRFLLEQCGGLLRIWDKSVLIFENMRVRLIKIHERYRVLIGEQIYSSHKYEFAVIVSQFRFVTRNLFARDARANYH